MCWPTPGTRRSKNRISAVTNDQNANPRFFFRMNSLRSVVRIRSLIDLIQRIPGIYRTQLSMT
jgi:hypothetical protein